MQAWSSPTWVAHHSSFPGPSSSCKVIQQQWSAWSGIASSWPWCTHQWLVFSLLWTSPTSLSSWFCYSSIQILFRTDSNEFDVCDSCSALSFHPFWCFRRHFVVFAGARSSLRLRTPEAFCIATPAVCSKCWPWLVVIKWLAILPCLKLLDSTSRSVF